MREEDKNSIGLNSIDLEQKLAKEIQGIYAKLLNSKHHPMFVSVLFSVLDEEISKIVASHPDTNTAKLVSLLEGDDEYSLSYIFETNNNSEDAQNETVALGENSNEAVDS